MKNPIKYKCFILTSVFLASSVFAQNIKYQFNWMKIPVADLSINFHDDPLLSNRNEFFDIEFKLSTLGPLNLYRTYSSEGYIRKKFSNSWDYYLIGEDRGQPEEKLISYSINREPVIKKFIDDAGVLPIKIDPNMDKNAVDPFSVLFRTIEQLKSEQRCQNEYNVMDGKRRYKITVELINDKEDVDKDKNNNKDIIFNCKFTFSELMEEKNKWPFNRKDRYLDIWFSSNLNYKPVRFFSKTPIGSIVGQYIPK